MEITEKAYKSLLYYLAITPGYVPKYYIWTSQRYLHIVFIETLFTISYKDNISPSKQKN